MDVITGPASGSMISALEALAWQHGPQGLWDPWGGFSAWDSLLQAWPLGTTTVVFPWGLCSFWGAIEVCWWWAALERLWTATPGRKRCLFADWGSHIFSGHFCILWMSLGEKECHSASSGKFMVYCGILWMNSLLIP